MPTFGKKAEVNDPRAQSRCYEDLRPKIDWKFRYMSLGVAQTLWRKHAAEAIEWVANAYTDVITGDDNHPYERIDGNTPVNSRYNASVGPLLGMGMPANLYSANVTVAAGEKQGR